MNEKDPVVHLPVEIDLLFDNKKLDVLKYLVIIYIANKKLRIRKLTLEELLYYYTLLYYVNNSNNTFPLIYKYLRDKRKINEIVIYLENLGYVKVHGDVLTKSNLMKISITKNGLDIIESWNSETIHDYLKKASMVLENFPYSKKNKKFQNLLAKGEFL